VYAAIANAMDAALCSTTAYTRPLYHASVGANCIVYYSHTTNRKKMKAYFFKVGNQAAWLFNISVDGLCIGDGINNYTLHKQAEHHAKLLAFRYNMPVKFWPQFKPQNTVVVEREINVELGTAEPSRVPMHVTDTRVIMNDELRSREVNISA